MIIVEEVDAQGGATVARFRFHDVLEATELRWMSFRNGRYVPFSPPAVGQSLIITPVVPEA
jgi:hypothetical protein